MARNVVLISVEDMIDVVRYRDAFGVSIKTPNIDRLMSMGVTFENAVTPVPQCSPARTALVTSQSPFATGVLGNDNLIQNHVPIEDTVFGAAHAAGFYTWSQGKIVHRQIDDEVVAYLDPVFDYLGKGGVGLDYHTYDGHLRDYQPTTTPEADLRDTVTSQAAAQFLTTYDGRDPFFMSVGISRPHLMWKVPQRYYDRYDIEQIAVPEIAGLTYDDLPSFFQLIGGREPIHVGVEARSDWAPLIQAYLAAISYADAQVGRVLRALDDSGHWDDTTVVLFSDHGYHLGDRDIWHKFTLWEEAASVPLIIADPDIARGTVSTVPASLLDIWPTLAGLTDLPAPARTNGVDLFTDHGREGVITSAFGSLSIRTAEWRYTVYQNGEEELFHVDDIAHAAPIADPDPTVLADLRALLLSEAEAHYAVNVVDMGASERGTDGADRFILIDDATAFGGSGDDAFFVTDGGVARGGLGYDTVIVAAQRYLMSESIEAGHMVARAGGTLIGNQKNNNLNGSEFGDVIRGKDGGDSLDGGRGKDVLHGNRGRDDLTGGNGRDTFVFKKNWDNDRILDFENNFDTLALDVALWGGGMTRAEVVDQFGEKTIRGVKLDFGDDEIFVDGIGLARLKNDIDFISS